MKIYFLTCDVCCKNKRGQLPNRFALKSYQAGSPMKKVHLDFLGPLPRTENGNKYIPIMVDSFTKWMECVPLPSQTAEVTAKAAIIDFFSQASGTRTKCLQIRVGTLKAKCARPCGSIKQNGQVERYNRTLMDAVRC